MPAGFVVRALVFVPATAPSLAKGAGSTTTARLRLCLCLRWRRHQKNRGATTGAVRAPLPVRRCQQRHKPKKPGGNCQVTQCVPVIKKRCYPHMGKAGRRLLACVVVVKLFSGVCKACFQHHVTASGKGQPSSFASHFMLTMT